MENRAHALVAGLFVIVLILALAATALWLTGDAVVRVKYLVVSQIPISGLRVKAPVRLRGVDVGRVEDIDFDAKDARVVNVTIAVDSDAPITRGTVAKLGYLGVTGLSFVQLEDDGSNPEKLATAPQAPGRIPLKPSLVDELGTSGPELLREAGRAAKRIQEALDDENLARLAHVLGELDKAATGIAQLTADLRPTAQALPPLAGDARRAVRELPALLTNLNTLVSDVRQRAAALDSVSRGAETVTAAGQALVADSLPRVERAAEDVSRGARALDRAVGEIGDAPSSLLFGRAAPPPGPGEPGFRPPAGLR